MDVPQERGPLSATLRTRLISGRPLDDDALRTFAAVLAAVSDPMVDEDLHLALAMAYELHHQGFDDAVESEWAPDLLAARATLERRFETALRAETAHLVGAARDEGKDLAAALDTVVGGYCGPHLSTYFLRDGSADEFRSLIRERSIYHLKEADAHTWAIPRLRGRAKAAMVEIQADEYGAGRPEAMHSRLFADLMDELGLDHAYGSYWNEADGASFATVNAMTMFGLHRRLRGACVGHLAVLEMTSTEPNRRYGNGLRRLGFGPRATAFHDVHVNADAVHEQIAVHDMAGGLLADEPGQRDAILFGAAACVLTEERFAVALSPSLGPPREQTPAA